MMKATHQLLGVALGLALILPTNPEPIAILSAAGLSSIAAALPDFDIRLGLKHRGITHSVWALVLVWALCGRFVPHLTPYLFGGYASHILADMLTVSGVPVFYPNPNRFKLARFRTGGVMDKLLSVCAALLIVWGLWGVLPN